ncbi:MAG: ribosome assembly RNA-binding protein YhbY [Legionellales bacterium]|nr:ribosome assembly RNA-binding protein YhbY [Legionellales bacterium]
MQITPTQKTQLKKLAHHLQPVVIIGNNGLSDAVINEIDIALTAHELIKIKVNAGDRSERMEIIESLARRSNAIIIQLIGHVLTVFRQSEDKRKAGKSLLG